MTAIVDGNPKGGDGTAPSRSDDSAARRGRQTLDNTVPIGEAQSGEVLVHPGDEFLRNNLAQHASHEGWAENWEHAVLIADELLQVVGSYRSFHATPPKESPVEREAVARIIDPDCLRITWEASEDDEAETRIRVCAERRKQWPGTDDCEHDGTCDECAFDMAEAHETEASKRRRIAALAKADAILSMIRPAPTSEGERRQCTVCTAIVSTYPQGMCCHCHEIPWPVVALRTQDTSR